MIKNFKRIVIKIGSSLLVEEGKVREKWLKSLTADISDLLKNDIEVVIVSSGAIALGKETLGKKEKLTIEEKQAAAAIGQINLMSAYQKYSKASGFEVAQILLTSTDTNSYERFNNSQNTLKVLLNKKIVPIINENDTVAVEEIKIGDNDRLAARVAQMITADLLILFSDIDGLYDKNPKTNSDAKLIKEVAKITKSIEEMASGAVSKVGTGGMITKIIAAKMAALSGCQTIITTGIAANCLKKLFEQKQNYTIFKTDKSQVKSRKKWLSGFMNAKGEVIVNDCARETIASKNVSLLPIGIVKVIGNFKAKDLIFIKDEEGNHIASGIANYSADEAKRVLGKNSDEVKIILEISKAELVHIDNLVVL